MLVSHEALISPGVAAPQPLVCHVITTLETGGAQMMLYKLLAVGAGRYSHMVISLGPEEPMAGRIRSLGVPVHSLGMLRSGRNIPTCFVALIRLLRRSCPAIVQTWMHHADLIGGLAARMVGIRAVVWGVRNSNLDPAVTKRFTIVVARLCGLLSRYLPSRILCCSQASRSTHEEMRYTPEKMIVIPNGFDLTRFGPSPDARLGVLAEFNLPVDAELIGLYARYHGMKDHVTFLKAAGLLARESSSAHFILCGDGVDWNNQELVAQIHEGGITDRVQLLGRRDDIPRLTAALDIAVSSSSSGEGFSNAIGEAMACGVVCVVTDVGDSASIVGETGEVVPPGKPDLLCTAWRLLLKAGPHGRKQRGQRARRRIEEHFSLSQVATRYEALYEQLLNAGEPARNVT